MFTHIESIVLCFLQIPLKFEFRSNRLTELAHFLQNYWVTKRGHVILNQISKFIHVPPLSPHNLIDQFSKHKPSSIIHLHQSKGSYIIGFQLTQCSGNNTPPSCYSGSEGTRRLPCRTITAALACTHGTAARACPRRTGTP